MRAVVLFGALISVAAGHRAQADDNTLTVRQQAVADILAHAFHGDVWVVTPQLYYCPGDRRFGRTEFGAYMSEAAAKAGGAQSVTDRPCAPAKPRQQQQAR